MIHVKEKDFIRFELFKKFLRQCTKTIPGRTQQNKKNRAEDSSLFQSLYSRKVVETIIALHLTSFTKKGISGVKQKK